MLRFHSLVYIAFPVAVLFYSCKATDSTMASQEPEDISVITEDTVEVVEYKEVEVKLYKGEVTRHFRLIHTKLDISLDWEKQWAHGEALLIVEPFFYDQSNIIVDAKGFDIHDVSMLDGDSVSMLNYKYDGNKLDIDLGTSYKKGQVLNLNIKYTAKPNEINADEGLLSSKKGMYFINPLGKQKEKPKQVWTHGETNTNSSWFPTLDAPNQKTTQELFITVDEKFETLSNGTLVYSKSNSDNTRTDYWKMDQPHAPYLFMLAVGEFAVIEDEWNDKKVNYYVDPDFAPYAQDIFGNTPEMISCFSDILNYQFPWDKYSQIVVRDFVSGAMENTSASIFMEDLQVDSRELLDYNWDDIIAHELFHQWFGDLVTCESWANLPLNESFATYSEYLWKMYKYGEDEASHHLYAELDDYLSEAEVKKENLIRFYYDDEDEMFDSHSYSKGGLILHMLRDYLGDDAFFSSLTHYLKKHEFGKAEVHDLRMAFEHVSGEDLNWFFNQWFLAAGHPKLKVEETFGHETYSLKVWQEQDIELYPVYKLPLTVDIWSNGRKIQYLIEVDRPYQEFEFNDVENPEFALVDSDFILVGEKQHIKTPEQYQTQFTNYPENVRARIEAIEYFIIDPYDSISQIVLASALDDSFWAIREEALSVFEKDTTDFFLKNEERIKNIALNDPKPLVKAGAIAVLSSKERSKYLDIYAASLNDSSYSVVGQALYAYLQNGDVDVDIDLAFFEKETNFSITSPIADYYIQKKDYEHFDWFVDRITSYTGGDLWYFTKLFGMYLLTAPDDQVRKGIRELELIARDHSQYFNRLSAFQSLELLEDFDGVVEILNNIKANEKDSRLLEYYNQ